MARSSSQYLAQPGGEAAHGVAASVVDALVGAGQGQPSATEGCLVLVQAVERIALCRFVTGAGHVHAAKVHLRAALPDRELDGAPAQQMERARRVLAGAGVVARMDG